MWPGFSFLSGDTANRFVALVDGAAAVSGRDIGRHWHLRPVALVPELLDITVIGVGTGGQHDGALALDQLLDLLADHRAGVGPGLTEPGGDKQDRCCRQSS